MDSRTDLSEAQKESERKESEQSILFYEQAMRSAPDSVDDVIDPVFTNEYIIAEGEQPESIELPPGETVNPGHETARQHYEKTRTDTINVKWEINGIPMMLDALRSDEYGSNCLSYSAQGANPSGSPVERVACAFPNTVENSSDLAGLHTTYEQAKALAERAVSLLGIDYMSLIMSERRPLTGMFVCLSSA